MAGLGDGMRVLSTENPVEAVAFVAVVERAVALQADRDKALAVMVANAINGHQP